MQTFRRSLVAAFVLVLAGVSGPAAADPIETSAKQAIIVDLQTGTALLEKNADDLMVPSSMSKLMTAYMVFEKLKEGSWKMDDMLPVSETAWKRHYKSGGSLMFLPVNSSAKVGDLTLPRRARRDMKVTAVYNGPIAAPVKKGETVGKLVVTAPGVETMELPLVAGADVARLGFMGRITTAIQHILWGPKG